MQRLVVPTTIHTPLAFLDGSAYSEKGGIEMKSSFTLIVLIVGIVVLLPTCLSAIDGVPKMTAVVPDTGKAGDILTVEGEFIGKASVAELYLTDGTTDWKCEIVEQSDTVIKFKVPAKAKQGRLSLMVLTAGPQPKLIEEPVKVTIE
jgi:hypothetical protein